MDDCALILCGRVELACDGESSSAKSLGGKALALLSYITLEARPHSRDALTALLWGEYGEEKARASFRHALMQLRAVLGERVQADRMQVTIAPPVRCDVHDFLRDAEANPSAAARIDMPRFLHGLVVRNCPDFEDWVERTRHSLRRRFAHVLGALGREAIARRDWRSATEAGERWFALEPLSEAAAALLAESHLLAGRRAAALATLAGFEDHLRAETGSEPGSKLQELRRRIAATREPTPRSMATAPASVHAVPALEGSLRGRAADWERLRAAWSSARAGRAAVALIEGDAGAGKSRLAGDFARWVASVGGVVLSARASEAGRGIPLAPIVELMRTAIDAPGVAGVDPTWLAEVARLVPELAGRWPGIPTPASATPIDRLRLFEGVAQLLVAIAEEEPVAIIVDELHWCDVDSCALLHFLVERLEGVAVLWCVTLTLGVDERDPAAERLERALRAVATVVVPAPLGEEDVLALVHELGRVSDPSSVGAFAQQLHAATAGNPFYVIETLRTLFADGWLRADPGSGEWVGPPGWTDVPRIPVRPPLHSITAQRIGSLSDDLREILITVAVAGHACSVDVLSHVHGISRLRAASTADALVERRLLEEAVGGYRCANPIAAEVVRTRITTSRRREVHRAIGLALELIADPDTPPGAIAFHAEQAREPRPVRGDAMSSVPGVSAAV